MPGTLKALKCSSSYGSKYNYYYYCQCGGYRQYHLQNEGGGEKDEICAGQLSGLSPHCPSQYRPTGRLQGVLEPAKILCDDIHAFFRGRLHSCHHRLEEVSNPQTVKPHPSQIQGFLSISHCPIWARFEYLL